MLKNNLMNTDRYILFDLNNKPYSPQDIQNKIESFGFGYNKAVADIIKWSKEPEDESEIFKKCVARILTNFKMTRSGPFKGLKVTKSGKIVNDDLLIDCWHAIGEELFKIKRHILATTKNPGRFLIESEPDFREEVFNKVWKICKQLLPFTMSKNSYGLVGASKVIFAILPEVSLPTDNSQWKQLFKTVDLSEVNRFMAFDAVKWERQTKTNLDSLGESIGLSTIPAVYNVMAMSARSI